VTAQPSRPITEYESRLVAALDCVMALLQPVEQLAVSALKRRIDRMRKACEIAQAEIIVISAAGSRLWASIAHLMRKQKPLQGAVTATSLIEQWGLRSIGGRLASAGLHKGTGDRSGVDEAQYAVDYVEGTSWFEPARAALMHVYGHGQPASSMMFRMPGETRMAALYRAGWADFADTPDRNITGAVVERFAGILAWRLIQEPYSVPRREEDPMSAWEAGAVAADELRAILRRRWTR